MIPWNKMTEDLQKAVLAMVVVLGGASASCRLLPIVCDPPPPPSLTPMLCDPPPPPPTSTPGAALTPMRCDPSPPTSPTPTFVRTPIICDPPPPSHTPPSTLTPMICDPPPPPSQTPTLTRTPIVCDPPPPPPSYTPTSTLTPMIFDPPPPPPETITPMICDPPPPPTVVSATAQFMLVSAMQSSDPAVQYAAVRGTVLDEEHAVLAGVSIRISAGDWSDEVNTSSDGTFSFLLPLAAGCIIVVGGDEANALQLPVNQHDVITLEWVKVAQESARTLPLTEVRTVDIHWQEGLSFTAETPWPGAHCGWTVSGGTLIDAGGRVTWRPPARAGRYLLQVVADWGPMGLAADALVLAVEDDGSVTLC